MTKEEANAKVVELKKQISDIWSQIEEICEESGIMVSRPDPDAYQEYYVTDKETFLQRLGYGDGDVDWIDFESRIPGWIGSAELE